MRNLEINVMWDGIFHMSTYLFTALGLYLLWRYSRKNHIRWSGKLLPGAMLIGFGAFNVGLAKGLTLSRLSPSSARNHRTPS